MAFELKYMTEKQLTSCFLMRITSDVFPARKDPAKVVLSTYESIESAHNI